MSIRKSGGARGASSARNAKSTNGARSAGNTRSASSARRTKRLTTASMFAALALIFSYIEFLIPISIGIPGIKLGFANLVIIIALYEMDFRYALAINLVRIGLSGLLFSGVFAMLYSLAGGLTSLLVMALLRKTGRFSMIGVSMAAGVSHNFGQLVVAALVIENAKMFIYFPVLVFSGIAAGIGIGILAAVLDRKVPKQLFR